MHKVPPREPASPPAKSPVDERYFDERDIESELMRTFQICHECRMCVNFCGSFLELFKRVDRDVDRGRAEGVEALSDHDIQVVSDECWQCKMCYVKCPYTEDDDAYELLDFPRLMLREKASRAKRNGVSLVDKVLGEPQLIGAMTSGALAPAGKLIQRNRLLRKAQQAVVGISADFPMPEGAAETFPQWMKTRRDSESTGEAGEVVLFATCFGNYNAPEVAKAAVTVLEHLGFRVDHVAETCCGMPNLDGGDIERFLAKLKHNIGQLLPHVEAGKQILVPMPTCSMTMKSEWYEYLPDPEVKRVAEATFDLMEFIEKQRRAKKLPPPEHALGRVAYHAPCHLRAQKIGFPAARTLSKAVPDTEVQIVQECSAVDGTWGMKAEHYDTGRRYAKRLVQEMSSGEPDLTLSDCGLSALRLKQELQQPVIHPIEALAKAYGL